MNESGNVVGAFGADHVVKLTGLSKGQLRYWDKTGFFVPQYADDNRKLAYSRVYSFRDVVGLRTLALLRKEHRVSLQHLRRVAEKLSRFDRRLWSETKLYVLNSEVHFSEPDSGKIIGAISGQFAVTIPLSAVAEDVSGRVQKLKERSKEQVGAVERHRYVARNAWVVAGTRIPTKAIQRFKEAGYSIEQILQEYPTLTRRDVEAALAHEERLAKIA